MKRGGREAEEANFLTVFKIDIYHSFFVVFVIVFPSPHEVALDYELKKRFNYEQSTDQRPKGRPSPDSGKFRRNYH
jgi:hypothetical protein